VLIVLRILFYILLAYVFLISFRIVLGWFAPRSLGRPWEVITAATDPYLRLFSRMQFLRAGLFDFSPVAAILVLVVALILLNRLVSYGSITLGFVLASVVAAAWSGVWFLLLFFLIVGVLRAIPLGFRGVSGAPLWKAVDTVIRPVVIWVMRVFRLGPQTGYTQHLLLTIGLLLVSLLLGDYIIWGRGPFIGIVRILESLPI